MVGRLLAETRGVVVRFPWRRRSPRRSTPWRFIRGWSRDELGASLRGLASRAPNFQTPLEAMVPANGWIIDGVRDIIDQQAPGPPEPDGSLVRGRQALVNYDFSDPRIVVGHVDPACALRGRDMLLEIKVFGLSFLGGTRVRDVRDECDAAHTVFGFR